MFNNRIVIAQKRNYLFQILMSFGKNYNDYKEIVNKYSLGN